LTLSSRKRNAKAHERNMIRQNDRMKKYSNYNPEDEEKQVPLQSQPLAAGSPTKDDRKPSPTSVETSSIDLQFQKSLTVTVTPQKSGPPQAASAGGNKSKYLTPIKSESHGKFVTPSKMPRQTSGNEETPTKSPFSGTLPDGVLSSPVALTPSKSQHLMSATTPIHKRLLHATSPSPPSSCPAIDPTTSAPLHAHYTPDVVSRAIFEALFGNSNKASSVSSSCVPWDEADDDDEDGDDIGGDDLYHCKSVEPVDELWFTRLMSTSLLTSQALDYALQNTSPTSFFQQQLSRGSHHIPSPLSLLTFSCLQETLSAHQTIFSPITSTQPSSPL
jgi:hypothetical protein